MSIIVVQHDWDASLRQNEKVWAFHKVLDKNATHGFLQDNNFIIVNQSRRTLLVKYVITKQEILYVSPVAVYDRIHDQSIINFDVAVTGELGASVSVNNKLVLWDMRTGSVKALLSGHLFDVRIVKFLPCGDILSAGADMMIKLWDTHTNQCKLTMTGHIGAITDIAIVGKGENIISVSRDGTARLWNVNENKYLSVLVNVEHTINCCAVTIDQNSFDLPFVKGDTDKLEVGTKGKLLAMGCENGKIILLDLFSREIMGNFQFPSAVICVQWLSWKSLVIGLEDGSVHIMNGQYPQQPTVLCHDHSSAVLCICPVKNGFILGRRDGICQYYSMDGVSKVQLIGSDCDPIYSINHCLRYVFTCSRDHKIRNGNQICTCGEDGQVLVWDPRAGKEPKIKLKPSTYDSLNRPQFGRYISSVDIENDWLICGGGPSPGIFHMRSLALTSSITVPTAEINVTKFTRDDSHRGNIIVAGNEPFVRVCSISGEVTTEISTTPSFIYSVYMMDQPTTMVTIAGSGPEIDVCRNLKYKDHSAYTYLS